MPNLTFKVESQAFLEARQIEDRKAADALQAKQLEDMKAADARKALLQAEKDKELAAKASVRAIKFDGRKMLSDKFKLENTMRKRQERQKVRGEQERHSNAANILESMRQDWAWAKEATDEESDEDSDKSVCRLQIDESDSDANL